MKTDGDLGRCLARCTGTNHLLVAGLVVGLPKGLDTDTLAVACRRYARMPDWNARPVIRSDTRVLINTNIDTNIFCCVFAGHKCRVGSVLLLASLVYYTIISHRQTGKFASVEYDHERTHRSQRGELYALKLASSYPLPRPQQQ